MKEKVILGIDPGTLMMGIAVLKQEGDKLNPLLIDSLNLKKETDYILKLKKIFQKLIEVIDLYNPDEMAIECPFLGENVQSMLKLGRAQGVAISACLVREIPVTEYTPKKIKMAVVGNGNASKQQVMGMVKNILNLKEFSNNFDASDAMAVAICHYLNAKKIPFHQEDDSKISNIKIKNSFNNWDNFVKNNKERVV